MDPEMLTGGEAWITPEMVTRWLRAQDFDGDGSPVVFRALGGDDGSRKDLTKRMKATTGSCSSWNDSGSRTEMRPCWQDRVELEPVDLRWK